MEKIIQEIRQDFINDLPNALDAIMISHLSGDMDALFQDVHKLKGAAAVCQYEKIAIMSENYCEAIRDKQFDEIDYYQAQLVLACSEAEA